MAGLPFQITRSVNCPIGDVVDAWHLRLDQPADIIEHLLNLLDRSERDSAERLRRSEDRARYIVSHAGMRCILGRYLARDPQEVRIVRDRRGKPSLKSDPYDPPLAFNLSHSGDHALLAVGARDGIGVDIEEIKPLEDLPGIAAMVLSPPELAALEQRDEDARQELFFQMWTRKEAVAKAAGEGLAIELRGVRIDPADPEESPRFQATLAGAAEPAYHGLSFCPVPGCRGALAMLGGEPGINWLDWPAAAP
jgi:4'-phosphopantetheinyl transferase